jgi:hypothetical protein
VEATITPPAHTGRKPRTVTKGNFTAIEGSRAALRFLLDRAPEKAQLRLYPVRERPKKAGSAAEPPEEPPQLLALNIEDSVLTGTIPTLDRDLDYEIMASTAAGMKLNTGKFRIRIRRDQKPTVRFLKPPGEIEAIPTTEVAMRIEARDDYGTAKVGIVCQVGDGPKETILLREEEADQPISLTAPATLFLENRDLDVQDGVTYYAFAEDNRPVKPQRAVTDLQFIDIRPFKRDYQLIPPGGT